MAKATKQTKKFVSSGKLKQEITKRRQHQKIKQKTAGREATKLRKERKGKGKHADDDSDLEGSDDEDEDVTLPAGDDDEEEGGKKGKGKAVEGLKALAGDDAGESDDEDLEDFSDLEEEDDADADDNEAALAADEAAMAKSLADLAKKDPEFFKYLKENDAELLDFEGGENEDEDDDEEVEVTKKTKKEKKEKKTKGKGKEQIVDEDEMMEYDAGSDSEEEPEFGEPEEQKEVEKVSVSMKMLRSWQRAMIEQSSLRSLRKTILAFRAAAHMNQDDEDEIETKYKIDSAQVFNKLILTALKFTPVVLNKHMPSKELGSGKFKTQPPPNAHPTLPRFALSHFTTIMYLIKSLPSAPTGNEDVEGAADSLLYTVVTESTKMLPWVMEGKRQVRVDF